MCPPIKRCITHFKCKRMAWFQKHIRYLQMRWLVHIHNVATAGRIASHCKKRRTKSFLRSSDDQLQADTELTPESQDFSLRREGTPHPPTPAPHPSRPLLSHQTLGRSLGCSRPRRCEPKPYGHAVTVRVIVPHYIIAHECGPVSPLNDGPFQTHKHVSDDN